MEHRECALGNLRYWSGRYFVNFKMVPFGNKSDGGNIASYYLKIQRHGIVVVEYFEIPPYGIQIFLCHRRVIGVLGILGEIGALGIHSGIQ